MNGESELRLSGIAVDCVIGDLPEERVREQRLVVDAALRLDLASAARSDDLSDTVDYAALAESIRRRLVEAKCRLVERAAAIALEECMRDRRVKASEVKITKAGAVPGLEAAAVVVRDAR